MLVVASSAVAGLPTGLVWWLLAPLPMIEKRGDGLYRAGGEGDESAVAADGWFAVLGLGAGVLTAVVVYLLTRPSRLAPLFGLATGGALGAVVAWQVGSALGPSALETTARGRPVGSTFDGPLDVSAAGVLLAWPLAAVITFFALAAGADAGEASPPEVIDRSDGVSPDAGSPLAPR